MRISTQTIPPGGWSHEEPEGRIIRASTYDELVKNLTADRIANQNVLGNPEKEIQAQQCDRNPQLCFQGGEEVSIVPQPRSFRERVGLWAKLRYNRAGDIKLVEQDEADRRASICQGCEFNSAWQDGCSPCNSHIERVLLLIRQNRKPTLAVGGCRVSGQDNTAAVMLPPELLEHRHKYMDELSLQCWMRDL